MLTNKVFLKKTKRGNILKVMQSFDIMFLTTLPTTIGAMPCFVIYTWLHLTTNYVNHKDDHIISAISLVLN